MVSFSELIKKARTDSPKVTRKAVLETAVGIVGRQGHFSGQLRASTNVALNKPDLSQIDVANYQRNAITNTKSSARARFKLVLESFKNGDVVFISNNKDYATYDEFKNGRLAFEGGKDLFQSTLNKAVASK